MSQLRRSLLIPVLLLVILAKAHADDAGKSCENTLAINWVLPGHFADALKQANAQQRLIMIKGIAFGIDDIGATCASKGCW